MLHHGERHGDESRAPDSQQLKPEFNMYWNEGEDHHYKSSDDKEFLDAVADNPMKATP